MRKRNEFFFHRICKVLNERAQFVFFDLILFLILGEDSKCVPQKIGTGLVRGTKETGKNHNNEPVQDLGLKIYPPSPF